MQQKVTHHEIKMTHELVIAVFCSDRTTRLQTGLFSGVVFHRTQLYGAECYRNEIHVFDYSQSALIQTRTVKLRFSAIGGTLRLRAGNNRLTCSNTAHHEILVYSLSGKFLQAFSRQGSGDAGRLGSPIICDVDIEGSVLIADFDNNRLQVMSEQGEFRVLDLQPQVSQPESAVIFSGDLYVTSYKECTVYKYSCTGIQGMLH